MEVHHPHHPTHKKKWSEYILEFVMLFAAVTLGFFAENIREHQVVEEHKVQNLTAMIGDLKQDSIEINDRIEEYSNTLVQFEKIKDLSLDFQNKKLNETAYIDSVVSIYLNAKYGVGLFINNASYKNTIASSSLSYIENSETKQLIAQYYEALYGKLEVNNKILDEDANDFMAKTFTFGFLTLTDEKLKGQTRSFASQIDDFKSIPAFRKLLTVPEFRIYVNKMEGRCGYYLYVMQMAKDLNNKLLAQLNKKEY